MAEEADLESVKCGFKSHPDYQFYFNQRRLFMNKNLWVKIKNFGIDVSQFAVKLLFNVTVAIMATIDALYDSSVFDNKRDEIVNWLEKFKN